MQRNDTILRIGMKWIGIVLLLLGIGGAEGRQVEWFMGWQPEARGDALFAASEDTPEERLWLMPRLARELKRHGLDLCSWEYDRYREALLSWRGVRSFSDFVARLFAKPVSGDSLWVFWSLGPLLKDLDWSRVPLERKVLVIFEPPVVQPEGYDPEVWKQFHKILTWDDDLVDGVKFFKYFYPVLKPRISEIVPFREKKFCAMFAKRQSSRDERELYSEREKVIRFFEDKPGEFDLFGKNWEKRQYRNWRGPVQDKIGTLRGYKFNVCYENSRDLKGYVTEKIFDAFAAGVVPIYWGASNIEEYVPEDCFIDRRRFGDWEELYRFLKGMSEEEYNGYLERAERFLQSREAARFTDRNFVETIASHLYQKPSS